MFDDDDTSVLAPILQKYQERMIENQKIPEDIQDLLEEGTQGVFDRLVPEQREKFPNLQKVSHI